MNYDVIVVGGGHAGIEAAAASARLGSKTLLITSRLDTLGEMSCNPAVGGIGKTHLVKEVDALGGLMARATDRAGIQKRTLNISKGAAVQALRVQCDRYRYKVAIQGLLANHSPHLSFIQAEVQSFSLEKNGFHQVVTHSGQTITARALILTTGTFLAGRIHVGQDTLSAGRAGEGASVSLASHLQTLGLPVKRLKTGTPPRLLASSIDFQKLQAQHSEYPLGNLSEWDTQYQAPKQHPCYLTHTNPTTQRIVQDHLSESALYSGNIQSTGPRYCPSFEDKVVRFAEKESHPVFLEPESLNGFEIYPNGLSNSLPLSVQESMIHSINGLENAQITRMGYAIEYDYCDPNYLDVHLQSTLIQGLFLAGQINGSTGYEEAASQGIYAGINAALYVQERPFFTLDPSESYLSVMIYDLTQTELIEPYRMFTSRAEYRLLLRQDNADKRLTEKAHALGLIQEAQWQAFHHKYDRYQVLQKQLSEYLIVPESAAAKALELKTNESKSALQLLAQNQINAQTLADLSAIPEEDRYIYSLIEADTKYAGYIAKQTKEINLLKESYALAIPSNLDFDRIKGLSNEVRERLKQYKPTTLREASNLFGITSAALSILRIYLKKNNLVERS